LVAAENDIVPSKVIAIAGNNRSDPDHPAGGALVSFSVKSWRDLEGENIAVNALTSISTAAMKGRLAHEGVKHYRVVVIPFANMGLAVAGGNVAAATMYEPFLTQSLDRGDGKLLDWIIGAPPFARMETTVTVFRAALRQSDPGVAKAFLRAQLQAVKWINNNPTDSRSVLAKYLNLGKSAGEKMRLLDWPMYQRHDPALLQEMHKALQQIGAFKASVPIKPLFDETLLSEILAEKR
jgi:ABC-type nitrate/sulfonate/bicarbonate transport system substrate-binding protein